MFEKYFATKPPFGTGDKKSEFPDAFVVDGLVEWTTKNAEPLYAISRDTPFRNACQPHQTLHEYATLSTLLDRIIFADEVAGFIRNQILARIEDIQKYVTQEFEDLMYNVDDQDGDAEMSVQSLELDGQPEIIDVDEDSAMVEVHFKGNFEAQLSYNDSSTGIYDNETKSMMFMEHKHETLDMEEEFIIEVKVHFTIFDPDSFTIEETSLVQPDEGYSVSTSR